MAVAENIQGPLIIVLAVSEFRGP